MPDIIVSPEGVQALLSRFKPTKAPGPDDITSRFLQEFSKEITPAHKLIFFPWQWGTIPRLVTCACVTSPAPVQHSIKHVNFVLNYLTTVSKENVLDGSKLFSLAGRRRLSWTENHLKNLMLPQVSPKEQFWDLYFSWYISMICLLLSYHFWGFLPMMPTSIASSILCVMHSSYKKTSTAFK